MAVYFRGMTPVETYALTDAMIRSGRTLDLGARARPKVVDKHSTGGVGDKTTIAVGPIVAACGVPVGKMSGRGLGHTGGTLDKLESIPGFSVDLSVEDFVAQVKDVGLAIVGQTDDLVPADKKLYGLRDVTGTVDILPLIASSIMSKKIAGGADAIVLDVKVGDGAFMKTLDDARALAQAMLDLGEQAGRQVVCLLTDMDQPLGAAVGNSLEIAEARDTVRGEGPPDFTELVLDACARLLSLSDLGIDEDEGRRRAEAAVADGSALAVYERWIRAQGGDPDPAALPQAPVVKEVRAPRAGSVVRLGAITVGIAALHLGAGRRTKEDAIDHSVGVLCRVKRGASVAVGDVLAEVHARDEASGEEAVAAVLAAYEVGDEPPREHPILLDVVEIVRAERPDDEREFAALIDAAFGDTRRRPSPPRSARHCYVPELTFVADDDGELIGFTMLSYVPAGGRNVLTLTPMAVRPDRQRTGVGKQVVRAAIAAAEHRGEEVLLVEGVPSYYPQFGFRSASELGFGRPDPRILERAWMALPLGATTPLSQAPSSTRASSRRRRRMPELPEVESVRRAIAPALQGWRLEHVEIDDVRLTRGPRTTHDDPVYDVEGVTHYCVANMPGAVPITSTKALTNVTLPYVEAIADDGLAAAVARDRALAGGVNVVDGKITYEAVAEAHGLEYTPLEDVLGASPVEG